MRFHLRILPAFLVFSILITLLPVFPLSKTYAAAPYLLTLNRPAYASSVDGNNSPDLAVDGNVNSRWSSAWGVDPQWLYVDLGANAALSRVVLRWESAYAKSYKIQVSQDEYTWADIYSTTAGDGATDDLTINATGRYVRLFATERALTQYGVSLFEFEVYGTGGSNPPPQVLGPNVALNKTVTASSTETSAWLPPGSTLPQNVVDGNSTTRWSSNPTDNEWIAVDLGSSHTLGRIILEWEAAAGRTYDIQVSQDNTNWTTIYRELYGDGGTLNLPVYATGRYLRMKGISRATGFGYSIYEFRAYDYVAGDPQPTYTIPAIPPTGTVAAGQGSYATNDLSIPQPKYPKYKSDTLQPPLPSNDWWQSVMINKLGNMLVTLPLKLKYTRQGLSILNPGAGWLSTDGKVQEASGNPDLYLMSSNINTSEMSNRITAYGDWSADVVLSDGPTDKMKSTLVKGSPYVFNQFSDPTKIEIYLPAQTRVFDDNNATLLTTDGSTLTGDRIGLEITNSNGAPTPANVTRSYGVFAPAGSTFMKVGNKIKIQLGSGQNYLSIATMPSNGSLNAFYQHAYAYITGTQVSYSFNDTTSDVTTQFQVTTSLKRTGFSNSTYMALLPHQWKSTATPLTSMSYPSIRGQLKVVDGNAFTTVNKFYGIVPQFTEPGDASYSRATLLQHLATLDTETQANFMKGDAYWEGKVLHPLAMGVLIADQIGDANYKNLFLGRMKTILSDWYTYTSGEPDYYFAYENTWGTMIYKHSEFGANSGITDHHFTYGYYVFASAILATYDQDFKTKYGTMVEHLIRDYANPSKTDPMYPFFRNFDPYEGHSWAGGYADNDNSGNNQEAAGEALFGWVGQYMWSLQSGDTAFRNAAIYGFTTELKAVEQYWFNYDQDNWLPSYTHKTVGQVYGSSNFFGTFFNGNPVYVYGIHWLPTAEYLTSYGFDPAKAATLYNGLVTDNAGPETDWYHIVWPIQSLSDSGAVLNKWNTNVANMQKNEIFNTYWFVHSMATLGQRSKDIWASGWSGATVYKKGTQYSAMVWNPTGSPVTVTFRNASGVTGSATVPAKSLVKVDPTKNNGNPTLTPPVLTADSTQNTVGQPIDITFTDNSAWRAAINSVKVNGTAANAAQYTVTAGKITLNAALFPQTGSYTIVVSATGYSDATVSQPVQPGGQPLTNLALNKTATASGTPLQPASNAVDGNVGTRWESASSDPQWIQVDLGAQAQVSRVLLNWEAAYGKAYTIQISTDGTTWTQAYSTTTGDGGIDDITFTAQNARYVRMNGTQRGTQYGYSLWEFEVYGTLPSNPGSNLALNKPSTSSASPLQPASNAVDGNAGTRWESAFSDPQWIQVDLGAQAQVNRVVLKWEAAYGKAYTIQVSSDGVTWTQAYATTTGDGGIDDISFAAQNARYVRMNGTQRGTAYGYSLWEFEVYGTTQTNPGSNLALNKPATSSPSPLQPASNAVDGNTGTRWESAFSDPQWIQVDLGAAVSVSRVVLNWETAYGKAYTIQVSTDGVTWTQAYSTTTGDGGTDDITFTARNARYVRVNGTQRATAYGYSLWEFSIYS